MTAERDWSCEFPKKFKFTKYQDKFLTYVIEKLYSDFDFSKLENEDTECFRNESHHLAVEFRNAQVGRIRGHFARGETDKKDELRDLDFVDIVHFAHNGVLEWEIKAHKCEDKESDEYIEANNEAYEWLKIARLAEHSVKKRLIDTSSVGNAIWPRNFSNHI